MGRVSFTLRCAHSHGFSWSVLNVYLRHMSMKQDMWQRKLTEGIMLIINMLAICLTQSWCVHKTLSVSIEYDSCMSMTCAQRVRHLHEVKRENTEFAVVCVHVFPWHVLSRVVGLHEHKHIKNAFHDTWLCVCAHHVSYSHSRWHAHDYFRILSNFCQFDNWYQFLEPKSARAKPWQV